VLQCVAVCFGASRMHRTVVVLKQTSQASGCSALQCVAVCCSMLQCVAVCCSVLQCVAACCSVLQCVAVCCSSKHSIFELRLVCQECNASRCSSVCSVLQSVAESCRVSQCVAVCCTV